MRITGKYLSILLGMFATCFPSILFSSDFDEHLQPFSLAISGGASKGAY